MEAPPDASFDVTEGFGTNPNDMRQHQQQQQGSRNANDGTMRRTKSFSHDETKETMKEIDDTPIIGKKFEVDPFSKCLTRFPLAVSGAFGVVLLGLSLALLLDGPKIVADLDGFNPTNSERYKDSQHVDETVAAWRETVDSRVIANWSRNYATRGTIAGRIQVVFEVDSVKAFAYWNGLSVAERQIYGQDFQAYSDALSKPTMLHVGHVIRSVYDVDYFNFASCWATDSRDPYNLCTPVNSLSQYYFPGQIFVANGDTRWSYLGYSYSNDDVVQGTTAQIRTAIESNQRLNWYVDDAYEVVKTARLTRIVIAIGTPVQTTNGIENIPTLFATDLVSEISKAIYGVSHPFVNTYVGGYKVFDAEVTDAVQKDLKWVLISCVFVFLAARIHMHSHFLAFCCVFQSLMVFAASMYLYSVFASTAEVPMLAVILYYVEMLMSLSGQMIAFDVFKWSGRLGERAVVVLTVAQRLALVIRHAGSAITMASAIIFAIFVVAAAASSIPVVVDFSEMMLLMTAINWLSLMIYFPACIASHHFYFSHKRRNLQKQRELRLGAMERTRIAAQLALHTELETLYLGGRFPDHKNMVGAAKDNLAKEVESRKGKMSIKAKLNLKPHFRKLGRRAANPLPPGVSNPEHSYWQTNGNENDGGENANHEQELQDGFANTDERGFVIQSDPFTLPLEQVIQIERMNCETMGRQDVDAVSRISASIGTVDTAGMDETKLFREVCGVHQALEFNETRGGINTTTMLLEVTRQLIHHVEGYGWAFTLPAPDLAKEANKGIREAAPPPKNIASRTANFLNDHILERNRKYFFGMIGPHEETYKARIARVKQLSTKKEGPNRMERLLGGPFLRFVSTPPMPYGLIALLAAFLVVGAVVCGFLDIASTIPTFLPRSSKLNTYNSLLTQFGDDHENCDYCSPYFTSTSAVSPAQASTCSAELGYSTPYATPNVCDSCTGSLDCRACDGETSGASVDECNQCLTSGDPRRNKCKSCVAINVGSPNLANCNECASGKGGPNCAATCTCSSGGGRCNAYTAACDCFTNLNQGYWQGSTCGSCGYGYTGSSCQTECSVGDLVCNCNQFTLKCMSCPAFMVGPSCMYQNPNTCDPVGGVPNGTTCSCQSGYAGTACKFHSACSGRGKVYAAGTVLASLAGKCICENSFFGPKCEYCRCYNGGTCNADGTCACVGDWSGSDCTICAASCSNGGYCPVAWHPNHYSFFTCRGLFCSLDDLASNGATPISDSCQLCNTGGRIALGCSEETLTCTIDTYNTTRPRNQCVCRGYWGGSLCSVCSPPYSNLYCNTEGQAVGCDGNVADQDGNYAVFDRCDVCGGDGTCIGCDGLAGNARLDLCGVCKGNNTCDAAHASAEAVYVLVELNADHAMKQTEFAWLLELGDRIWTSTSVLYSIQTSNHFAQFIRQAKEGDSTFISTTVKEYLAYSLSTRLAENIGFGYASATVGFDNPDRLQWIMYEYRANGFNSKTTTKTLRTRFSTLERSMMSLMATAPSGYYKSWSVKSSAFVALGTRDAITWDTVLIVTLAGVITICLLAVYVCSVKLVLAGIAVLATSIVCAFATVRVLSLEYGPVEMILVLFVIAYISSIVVYMADGYMEELHAVQSHLMALATTRRQNVKGMLRRTGIPVILSTFVLFLSSLLLLGAEIDVINNVGKIMAISSILTLIFVLLGLPSLLSLFGPHKIRRNKVWMGVILTVSVIICVVLGIALHFARKSNMVD